MFEKVQFHIDREKDIRITTHVFLIAKSTFVETVFYCYCEAFIKKLPLPDTHTHTHTHTHTYTTTTLW